VPIRSSNQNGNAPNICCEPCGGRAIKRPSAPARRNLVSGERFPTEWGRNEIMCGWSVVPAGLLFTAVAGNEIVPEGLALSNVLRINGSEGARAEMDIVTPHPSLD